MSIYDQELEIACKNAGQNLGVSLYVVNETHITDTLGVVYSFPIFPDFGIGLVVENDDVTYVQECLIPFELEYCCDIIRVAPLYRRYDTVVYASFFLMFEWVNCGASPPLWYTNGCPLGPHLLMDLSALASL